MKSEVINNEAKEIKNLSAENYKNIRPEKEMSPKEVNDFWSSEFKNEANAAKNGIGEVIGLKEYFDDNDTKYREGDKILPNTKFEVNGYKYETDDKGRTISAEGHLRIKDPEYTRNMEDVKNIDGQEYRARDDRGHLIAHRFGGSDKLENLVPMDAKLNQGDFAKMENTLADALNGGADVRLKVEPIYEGGSTRPSEFCVSYSIDGDKNVTVFRNESEVKT